MSTGPLARVACLAALFTLAGCASYVQPMQGTRAHPGIRSAVNQQLRELPGPQERVVVAVYRFRDQTGQYKASDRLASWSTAVTQGSTSILIRALEESGWFVPIEREGLSNLLNERQIIQSTRAQHLGPNGEPLGPMPPLLYAGVMLEGGIIGYDTNVLTGGVGARYFGAGASGQFRQDQVTIYLRAVSTQSGRVLKTVYTTKTIVSQKVDGGLFRFIDLKRILEAEAGYSVNEPPVLAVTEAIEEAVRSLVIEGVREGLWAPVDPIAFSDIFLDYDRQVAQAEQMDYYGNVLRDHRRVVGAGVSIGAQRYQGNYVDPEVRPSGEIFVRGNVLPELGLGLSASAGELAAGGAFRQRYVAADVHLAYYLLPRSPLTPFVQAGIGAISTGPNLRFGDGLYPYLSGSVGVEYMPSPHMGVSVAFGNQYALHDGLDGITFGSGNDSIWGVKLGFVYYLTRSVRRPGPILPAFEP